MAARLIRVFAGSLLLVIGIAGLFLPVLPGWLLIIPGLALLARDFVWADRLHVFIKDRFEQARRSFEHRRDPDSEDRKAA